MPTFEERYKAEMAEDRVRTRSAAQRLAGELNGLDFTDVPSVLRWIEQVPPATDHVDVIETFPWDEAVALFEAHGYVASGHIDVKGFDDGAEASARMIINFALNGMMGRDLTYSRIPPYTIGYIRRWFELYGS